MSGNCVIVAIPAQGDRVYEASSEKIPHCTLLALGEMEPTGPRAVEILTYLEHAVKISFREIMMDVDTRGPLGPQEADVLFFYERDAKPLREFRSQLLQNLEIFKVYSSNDQYPDWTPHLTMGYPETPAKDKETDHPINWVSFDRIALWFGDYEGVTFRAPPWHYDYDEGSVMAMSAEDKADAVLKHYGVKGMRWGQRKSESSAGPAAAEGGTSEKTGKTVVKVSGGQGIPASKDALGAAKTKQVLAKSGTHALSNKELQDLATRMNLEQQVVRLRANELESAKSPVNKWIKKKLQITGDQAAQKLLNETANKQVSEMMKKQKAAA